MCLATSALPGEGLREQASQEQIVWLFKSLAQQAEPKMRCSEFPRASRGPLGSWSQVREPVDAVSVPSCLSRDLAAAAAPLELLTYPFHHPLS